MLSTVAIRAESAPKDGDFCFNVSELEAMLPSITVDLAAQRIYPEVLMASFLEVLISLLLVKSKGEIAAPKRGFVAVDLLTDTVDAAKKPSVAAIDGLSLGGGLEIAMACHARVSTANAQLRLPELQLGILLGIGDMLLLTSFFNALVVVLWICFTILHVEKR